MNNATLGGLRPKWETIQILRNYYESCGLQESFKFPVQRFLIRNRLPEEIDGILESLRSSGCFSAFNREGEVYSFEGFNTNTFYKECDKTEKAYHNLATNRQYELRITYSSGRPILLNGKQIGRKPNAFGENEIVFEYLYNHPNRKFTKKQIEQEIKTPIQKSFHKIIENLGFTGNLKQLFFKADKDHIQLNNPVYSSEPF